MTTCVERPALTLLLRLSPPYGGFLPRVSAVLRGFPQEVTRLCSELTLAFLCHALPRGKPATPGHTQRMLRRIPPAITF